MRFEEQPWNRITSRFEVVLSGIPKTGRTPTSQIKRLTDSKYWNGATWQVGATSVAMTEIDSTNEPGVYEVAVLTAQLDYTLGLDGYRFWVTDASEPLYENGFIAQQRRSAWDDVRADHTTAATFGQGVLLQTANAGSIINASFAANAIDAGVLAPDTIGASELATSAVAEIAGAVEDSVWDALVTDHVTVGSIGHRAAVALGIGGQVYSRIMGQSGPNPTYDVEGRLLTARHSTYPTSADALADTNAIDQLDVTCTYDVDGNLATLLSE
jgi:hypothetical protein